MLNHFVLIEYYKFNPTMFNYLCFHQDLFYRLAGLDVYTISTIFSATNQINTPTLSHIFFINYNVYLSFSCQTLFNVTLMLMCVYDIFYKSWYVL